MPHVDPLAWLLTGAAGVFVLGALAGRWLADRRHRWDRIDGVDDGTDAERAKWEQATGRTFEEIQAKLRARPLPLPDPAGQGTEQMPPVAGPAWAEPPPPADELLAQADALLTARDDDAAAAYPEVGGAGVPEYLPAGPEPKPLSQGLAQWQQPDWQRFQGAAPEGSPAAGAAYAQAQFAPASLPRAAYSPQVAAYARLAMVRAETAAFLAQTDARCGAFLALMHAETDAFLSGLPQ